MLVATRIHTACRGAWPPHSCMLSAASPWGPQSGWRRRFVAGKSCGPRRHTGNGCPAANPAISIGCAQRAFLSRDACQRLCRRGGCIDGYPRLVIVSDTISCRRATRAQHHRVSAGTETLWGTSTPWLCRSYCSKSFRFYFAPHKQKLLHADCTARFRRFARSIARRTDGSGDYLRLLGNAAACRSIVYT
jgi:hypothetical protein